MAVPAIDAEPDDAPTPILAGVLLASPVLAAGPYAKFSVGNWAGGAVTNNQTGDFSYCAVSASYKSGVTMHASLNGSYGWNLGFSNRAWGLKPGDSVPMELAFDRNDIVRINAKAEQPARRRDHAGELQHRPRLPRRP